MSDEQRVQTEAWEELDFEQLRGELGQQIDAIIRQVEAKQEEGRTQNNQQLEDTELVNKTGQTIQKDLTKNLVATTQTITQVEKANYEFDQTLAERDSLRHQLTSQIGEIVHLMRMLECEIATQQATKEKVEFVAQKEQEMQQQKDTDETTLVRALVDDISSQSRSLNTQVVQINAAEESQVRIQNELVDLWKTSCAELEQSLKEAKSERDGLAGQLDELRKQVHQKMVSNEQTIAVNTEVEFEVQRMTDYAGALQDNLENMAKDYQLQFESVLATISKHNDVLTTLQEQHSDATKNLYSMAIENERLESQLLAMKADRDVHVVIDERHKIELLRVDTADALRRAQRMEQSCAQTIKQWQNRVNVMQRQVMAMQQSTEEQIQHGLIERLMGQIKVKNEQLTELSKQKMQIESKLTEGADQEAMQGMQERIEELIQEFEHVINQRIDGRQQMIDELKKIQSKSKNLNWAHEDIKRVKCAIDLAQKDIHQKRQVSIEMSNERDEIQVKNQELDDEIAEYERQLEVEELKLAELTEQAKVLSEEVDGKEQELGSLEDNLAEAEQAKQAREDEEKRKEAALAAERARQPKYVPIPGDVVDELMAKHLNESDYHIDVRALGDGHYMLGNKKIFAKIVADKLVIKQGGGFMLIDEFIKNYSEGNTMTGQTSTLMGGAAGRMSPPRRGMAATTTAQASPKRRTIK